MLKKKWQLIEVLVDDEITDKPNVINWLKQMNNKIAKSTVVTEYSGSGKLFCYLDNYLLNGINADKTENDIYRLVNNEGHSDDHGSFILYCFQNKKTKTVTEEIVSLTDQHLITKSYDADFIKMAGGNHLIFVYKSHDS